MPFWPVTIALSFDLQLLFYQKDSMFAFFGK
jgi:hypothetical protein